MSDSENDEKIYGSVRFSFPGSVGIYETAIDHSANSWVDVSEFISCVNRYSVFFHACISSVFRRIVQMLTDKRRQS